MAEYKEKFCRKRRRTSSEDVDSDQENFYPKQKMGYTDSSDTDQEDKVFWQCQNLMVKSSAFQTPHSTRASPLPSVPWADSAEMWKQMLKTDEDYGSLRRVNVFERHPTLGARMRSIVLEWLSEVCEVFRLTRETYFLAIDYIDRYLSASRDLHKNRLQLLGITCLFTAAKIEEIYPPKLSEFSYVTDGACTDQDIVMNEMTLLSQLKWDLKPLTINYWLSLFMQIYIYKTDQSSTVFSENRIIHSAFIYPQYSAMDYALAARICNLASLDADMLRFSYATIATASLYHLWGREMALAVSGMSWSKIKACVEWMQPFATTVKECSPPMVVVGVKQAKQHCRTGLSRSIPKIIKDEAHMIQMHNIDLDMLDKAKNIAPHTPCKSSNVEETPARVAALTPPTSGQKSTA